MIRGMCTNPMRDPHPLLLRSGLSLALIVRELRNSIKRPRLSKLPSIRQQSKLLPAAAECLTDIQISPRACVRSRLFRFSREERDRCISIPRLSRIRTLPFARTNDPSTSPFQRWRPPRDA